MSDADDENVRIIDCRVLNESWRDPRIVFSSAPMDAERYIATPDCLAALGRFLYDMTQLRAVQACVDGEWRVFLSRRIPDSPDDFVDRKCGDLCNPWASCWSDDDDECKQSARDVDIGTKIEYFITYEDANFDWAIQQASTEFDEYRDLVVPEHSEEVLRDYLECIHKKLRLKNRSVVISDVAITLANSEDEPNDDHRGQDHFGCLLDFHPTFTLEAPVTLGMYIDGLHRILSFKTHKRNYELLCGVMYYPELSSETNTHIQFRMDYGS
jgi:hypothetical protein